jgi:hypothetical protein
MAIQLIDTSRTRVMVWTGDPSVVPRTETAQRTGWVAVDSPDHEVGGDATRARIRVLTEVEWDAVAVELAASRWSCAAGLACRYGLVELSGPGMPPEIAKARAGLPPHARTGLGSEIIGLSQPDPTSAGGSVS